MIALQKAAIYRRIESLSNSYIVHPGIDFAARTKFKPQDIPGVRTFLFLSAVFL